MCIREKYLETTLIPIITPEETEDQTAVWKVNRLAFQKKEEADLVDTNRINNKITLSLVAKIERKFVGHILFSQVRVVSADHSEHIGIGLGPIAVLPAYQNKGIRTRLIRYGVKMLKTAGHPFVIVLGHPTYYPRFGFVPSSKYGISWEQTVPDDIFMALELTPGALDRFSGIVYYHSEFDAV